MVPFASLSFSSIRARVMSYMLVSEFPSEMTPSRTMGAGLSPDPLDDVVKFHVDDILHLASLALADTDDPGPGV